MGQQLLVQQSVHRHVQNTRKYSFDRQDKVYGNAKQGMQAVLPRLCVWTLALRI